MSAFDRIVTALQAAGAKRSGWDWTCPVHPDRSPSLTVKPGNGKAFIYCHSCGKDATPAILEALGLSLSDLYDEPRGRKPRIRRRDSREKSPRLVLVPDTDGCCIGCCFPLHDACSTRTVHIPAEVIVHPYERAHNQAPRPYCPECARRHREWEAAYPRQQDHWPAVPRTSPRGLLLCGMCDQETTDPVGHGICGECFYMLKDRETLSLNPFPSLRRGS